MYCRTCGYSLAQGSGDACPECGTSFERDDPRTWRERRPSRFAAVRRWAGHAAAVLLTALLVYTGVFIWQLDQWVGVSTTTGFVPVAVVFGGVVSGLAWGAGRSKLYLVPFALYAAFIVTLACLDLWPVEPTLRAMRAIEPGMTRQEAKDVVDAHFPADGRFSRPVKTSDNAQRISYSVDPTDGRYNAAILVIRIDEDTGLVSDADFSPD